MTQSLSKECGHATLAQTKKCEAGSASTLPIFFTAAASRALSSATNFENSGDGIRDRTAGGLVCLDYFGRLHCLSHRFAQPLHYRRRQRALREQAGQM